MSISVQFDMGKNLKCSPCCFLPLKMFQSSGRWFCGCHSPKSFLCEKNLSLARAFSSSRRPPPPAASNPCSSMVSRRVTVCRAFLLALSPVSSLTEPSSIDFWTLPMISFALYCFAKASRNVRHSGKLWPVSMCTSGKGIFAG